MSALRVARIPYLNSVPFYQTEHGAGVELIDLPPRDLGRAAREGRVDAGIMSMCDAFRTPDFEPLGALGVAADGPAHSVLLLSRSHPSQLDGASVGITGETSTSVHLLRLVLEGSFGVRPARYERRPRQTGEDDAHLLIGDAALRAAASGGLLPGQADYGEAALRLTASGNEQPWNWALDLGAAWKRWLGMPFVFARWMVRRDADEKAREALLRGLDDSLDRSLRDLREVSARYAAMGGLDAEAAYSYLMGFTYRLGEPEEDAIRAFLERLGAAEWWEASQPSSSLGAGA